MCHHDGLGFGYLFLTVIELKLGSFCDTPQQIFFLLQFNLSTKNT